MRTGAPLLPGIALLLATALACGPPQEAPRGESPAARPRTPPPGLLLVTLDTTRADAVAPEGDPAATPTLAALAARATRFTQAFSTAPMTLPAHASLLTGLYPAGHGVHENGRSLPAGTELLAERLKGAGYQAAAFVSGYPLDRQFGLARGFDPYDDEMDDSGGGRPGDGGAGEGGVERRARATTERALDWLARAPAGPLFVWVHYYDPHDPYEPPEPFASRFTADPYRGEIAAMDAEIGRLLAAFEERSRSTAPGGGESDHGVIVVGDHGESRGEHGERFHGNLLYQGAMRVPLILAGRVGGEEIPTGEIDRPVSTRRVFDTLLGWARGEMRTGLLGEAGEASGDVVLAEAMAPYLQYGWQPQVMAVAGRLKILRSGATEVYDVVADPLEGENLAGRVELSRQAVEALRDYPLPGAAPSSPENLDPETRQRLAALGYLASSGAPPRPRPNAPSPREMTHLFGALDEASRLFANGRYREAIPVFEHLLSADPGNLGVALRLAAAHSALGRDREALEAFDRAREIDPTSLDLSHYLGLHHLRAGRFEAAAPLLAAVLAAMPDRLPALEALAEVRERQGRLGEATTLLRRAVALERNPLPSLLRLGDLAMAQGDTPGAITAFEEARALWGEASPLSPSPRSSSSRSSAPRSSAPRAAFPRSLELGVAYLAAGRLAEAAMALDRVPPEHPAWPMALFKRAQVAVLLGEADQAERIRQARDHADALTRPLIASEALFRR